MHHPNPLGYDADQDSYALSSLFSDVYFFPRAGATSENIVHLTTFVGPNTTWGERQHRALPLPNNHLLLFANSGGEEDGMSSIASSAVIEYNLDDGQEVWRYESGHQTSQFGDVQRLPGGNTLVTYSNPGVIHEVTPNHKLVLEVVTNEDLGYATWVPSLYGSAGGVE